MKSSVCRASAFILILFAFIIAGCGDAAVHDNEDKYEIFKDETVIGAFNNKVYAYYNDMGKCEKNLGELVALSMMKSAGSADFAVINAGSLRFRPSLGAENDFIGPGAVTKGDVAKFLPFDNPSVSNQSTISLITLNGSVIKEMFENAFSRMTAAGGEGTSFGRFLQVPYYIRVYADVTNPVGSRITAIHLRDYTGAITKVINFNDTSTTYRVAVPTKYIKDTPGYQDFDQYWDILAKGTNIVDTKIYIYDAVVDFIKNNSPINIPDGPSCIGLSESDRLLITHR